MQIIDWAAGGGLGTGKRAIEGRLLPNAGTQICLSTTGQNAYASSDAGPAVVTRRDITPRLRIPPPGMPFPAILLKTVLYMTFVDRARDGSH